MVLMKMSILSVFHQVMEWIKLIIISINSKKKPKRSGIMPIYIKI